MRFEATKVQLHAMEGTGPTHPPTHPSGNRTGIMTTSAPADAAAAIFLTEPYLRVQGEGSSAEDGGWKRGRLGVLRPVRLQPIHTVPAPCMMRMHALSSHSMPQPPTHPMSSMNRVSPGPRPAPWMAVFSPVVALGMNTRS